MEEKKIKVALYAGSFNPMHIGHEAIISTLSKEYDKVLVEVTPRNPLKDANCEDNYEDRLSDAKKRIAKLGLKNVEIDDIQKKMGPPYNSIILLNTLSQRNPDYDIHLAIGSDCLSEFDQWRRWKDILANYAIVVLPRKGYLDIGYYIRRLLSLGYKEDHSKWRILEIASADIPEISSTEIRKNPEKFGYKL